MARECEYRNCYRTLKSGRKYCHVHRSFGKERQRGNPLSEGISEALNAHPGIIFIVLGFVFGIAMSQTRWIVVGFIAFFIYELHRSRKKKKTGC